MAHYNTKLLSRDAFREGVFARDDFKCVMCYEPAQDAHHIMERRLWPDGGYYLDNGASVCESCHISAEKTLISCQELRDAAGIESILLPPHLYRDQEYDKWGNIINPDSTRTIGELYYDPSVYKILEEVRHYFVNDYVKYPRTYHLPSSPGKTKDDRVIDTVDMFDGKRVIVTEKMDGENTTIYSNGYVHARSIDGRKHISRTWVKNFSSRIAHNIPLGYRVCGENLFARHSIPYSNLKSYFLGFSIWDMYNNCLSWDNTVEWFKLLGIECVPILYDGPYYNGLIEEQEHKANINTNEQEGFVIRTADAFAAKDFRKSVAKWVRPNHVQTSHNWMRQQVVQNELEGKNE